MQNVNVAEVKLTYQTKVKASDRQSIRCSRDAYEILREIYPAHEMELRERFVVLLLNRANKVLGWHLLSVGGVSGAVVDPRLVFQAANLANASAIILSHNHPSGNTDPSKADIDLTRKIKRGADLLNITVADHIIVTADGYLSFANEGLL